MRKIGIKFLLKDQQFLAVGMGFEEAKRIVGFFSKPGSIPPIISGWDDAIGGWAVDTSSIHAVHTFSLEDAAVQEAAQQAGQVRGTKSPWGGNGSGL